MKITQIFLKNKISSILVSFLFVVFFVLGSWQLYRLKEKNTYINEIFVNLNLAPIETTKDQKFTKYSKVEITGRILADQYIWLYRRHPQAKYIDGAYLAVPIVDKNNNIFLSILGWVEHSKKQALLTELSKIGYLTLQGLLINSEKESMFIPSNDYKNNICFTMDIADISLAKNIELNKFFIATLETKQQFETQIFMITPEMMIKVKNDHLEYAATWYGLGCSLLFIYWLFLRKRHLDV